MVPNIKVLTWNYDLQFEIAYSKYKKLSIPKIQEELQSYPQILGKNDKFDSNFFSIVHLNGVAYDRSENRDFIGYSLGNEEVVFTYIIEVFHEMLKANRSDGINGVDLLSFAWEKLNEDFSLKESKVLEHAFEIASQTEWLIINGYSFPSFNRILDTKLLKSMNKLEKVSIQSPNFGAIQKIVRDIKNVRTENVEYWDQFFIPDFMSI